ILQAAGAIRPSPAQASSDSALRRTRSRESISRRGQLRRSPAYGRRESLSHVEVSSKGVRGAFEFHQQHPAQEQAHAGEAEELVRADGLADLIDEEHVV